MSRLLAAAVLASLAACHRDSPPASDPHAQPAPPPGTGTQAIDMEGQWMIFAIERLDGGPAPSGAFLGAPLFVPLQVGQVLEIRDGRLCDASGAPLYEPSPIDPEDFYANTADGRVLWFEVEDVEAEPLSQLSVEAIFGSAGGNMIEGYVTVFAMGSAVQSQFLSYPPNGVFHVRAGRVMPAPLHPPGGIILPPVDGPAAAQPAAQPISVR